MSDRLRRTGAGNARGRRTVHLVGPGQVGRRLLRLLVDTPLQVVAVTDSSATVRNAAGVDVAMILAHKEGGGALRSLPDAEAMAVETAIAAVAADCVADATSSALADSAEAVRRARAALACGAFLALAGKNALAEAAPDLLLGEHRGRVGVQATFGGAGARLLQQLDELRGGCREVVLVGNATTTVVLEAVERGASLEAGIAEARRRGLLEPDPALDLDGVDAATKLRAVYGAVFGEPGQTQPAAGDVARQPLSQLAPEVVRERARRGATTRLVGRARRGGPLTVGYEELARASALAAGGERVVYAFDLGSELRVIEGTAVGYELTAAALCEDLRA